MGLYRKTRRGDSLHLLTGNGPVVIRIKSYAAELEIEAPPAVKINHKRRRRLLTAAPRKT